MASVIVTGGAVPVRFGLRRAGDPPSLHVDAFFAPQRLDFVPRWFDIGTIVRTALPSLGHPI